MEGFTGQYTTNHLPIYSLESVNKQRALFRQKKVTDYIAQPGGQENAVAMDVDIIITGGNRGGGKANSYDTPVITPGGTVLMGDLREGDPVATPFDGTQRVEAIFEQGEQNTYRVTFDDGSFVKVMGEHRFLARKTPYEKYTVMTLDEIKSEYRIGHEFPNSLKKKKSCFVEIPLCGEVSFREGMKPYLLPVHPYALGAFSCTGTVTFQGTGLVLSGYNIRAKEIIKALGYKWFLNMETGVRRIYGITPEQREYLRQGKGFTNNKFRIPDDYKMASKESRWELVRAIFDMNSSYFRGMPAVKSKNKGFLEDFIWIARSLGIWCKLVFVGPDTYYACAKYKDNALLYHSPVKKHWEHPSVCEITKKIIEIKLIGKKKCRCIQVSGKDHLYLTDAFTINHNTVMLLMGAAYFLGNPAFNGIILRKESADLSNIIRESGNMYGTCGTFKSSYNRWDMYTGAQVQFSYYVGLYDDFKDRMQGRQYAYIGIDEITQISFEKFKYLITANRNGAHIRNRLIGTCNPDPTSWVARFIDWWIGEDGYPIKERDTKIRYCFMGGETPQDIVWGDSREEVYLKVKNVIDSFADDRDVLPPEQMYIKSVTFVRAELDDNRALLDSSPEYKANLAQQSDEQRERDFKGNWKYMSVGTDIVKMYHLQRCFENAPIIGDGVRRASLDVAFDGGDACVLWLWIGWHVADVFVSRLDSKSTVTVIRAKIDEWRVAEENLVYDMQGVGQIIKGFFKKAKPFSNQETVGEHDKGLYDTVKSKCAFTFADKLIQGEISFEPSLLTRKFSGKGFKNLELREILMQERKILRADEKKADRGKCLIQKDTMKKIIHRSPDYIESLFMRMAFENNRTTASVPDWLMRTGGGNRITLRKFG